MRPPFDVVVDAVARARFFAQHNKDAVRAKDAWDGLLRLADRLRSDPFGGTQVPKDRFPSDLSEFDNLWKLDLPHALRAVYSVMNDPARKTYIAVVWLGDHHDYERLFAYR